MRNIVIVGADEPGRRLIEHLDSLPDSDIKFLGVFDDRSTDRLPSTIEGYPTTGNVDDLLEFVRENSVDLIIVALPWSAEERLLSVLDKLRTLPMDVRLSPDLIGFRFPATSFSHIGGIPLFNVHNKPLSDWSLVTKRAMDVFLTVLFLVLLLPVFLVIACLVKLDSPGPVIFSQRRYGFNNQLIKIYKFRTMYSDQADPDAERLTSRNDPRVTRIGRFLRRWSLDELPQLNNVLKGDMSIVGPRPHPLLAKAAGKLYEDAVTQFAARYRVKPGITGWAQVNGWRGETETINDIKKRVEFDIYYIENWSTVFDVKIIIMTIFSIILGKNAH